MQKKQKENGKLERDDNGRKEAVAIPISEYMKLLEDLHNLAVVAERRDKPTMSLKEVNSR